MTDTIHKYVTDIPKKAHQIAKEAGLTRSEVNRWLYMNDGKLVKRTNVDNPPLWVTMNPVVTQTIPTTWVFVDLGNIHDVLQQLEKEMANGLDVGVVAVADLQYNGYGINPEPENPEIKVCKSNDPHKNSADVRLVWEVAMLLANAREAIEVHVVTKDNGFRSLKDIVDSYGGDHSVEFHSDWDSLKYSIC